MIRYWERTQKQYSSQAPPDRGTFGSIDDALLEQIMNPYEVNSA